MISHRACRDKACLVLICDSWPIDSQCVSLIGVFVFGKVVMCRYSAVVCRQHVFHRRQGMPLSLHLLIATGIVGILQLLRCCSDGAAPSDPAAKNLPNEAAIIAAPQSKQVRGFDRCILSDSRNTQPPSIAKLQYAL